MGAYALGILPMRYSMLNFVLRNNLQIRKVVFADDPTVAGKLTVIKNFLDKLAAIRPKYRHFPKSTKSYLIVKKEIPKRCKDQVY